MGIGSRALEDMVSDDGGGADRVNASTSFWRGRRVLVTGHTGFKGAWLCQMLLADGAEVAGFALPPDTTPSLFTALELAPRLRHETGDIRQPDAIAACIGRFAPETVLHLAAQPLVRRSYREPLLTWATNVQGTVHLLEAVRACPSVRACVVVTSDKCYENRETARGYREDDPYGGHDPYSASKGAAELAVASWRRSYPDLAAVASARAGNVIGGGDWSRDRIVTDFVAAVEVGEPLRLRHPAATRPWQHVLEPLTGYLELARRLLGADGRAWAEGWNFGPDASGVATVGDLARELVAAWGAGRIEWPVALPDLHEAGMLSLDCGKAAARLDWRPRWGMREAVTRTARWYRGFGQGIPAARLCQDDLDAYRQAGSR